MTDQPMPEEIQACAFFLADHAVVENGKLYINGGLLAVPRCPGT